ncbi:MAG: GNAT family N-acetyltransferase [Nitrosopumilaceae archaeon]|nr:GNAT family N-acetyltransferase [Nitrosopumilaceae archaeon]
MPSATFSQACVEISQNLLAIQDATKSQIKSQIKQICTKYALERIPKNHEILSTVSGNDYTKLQKILLKKPVKTASGVAVIALMPKPYACPHGRCTYCPGGIEFNSPNSYTGNEPSTINAIENLYDPKKQITSKIDKLVAYGHDPSKMELVIVGGTFLFMPKNYQIDFIKLCYDALNGFDSPDLESAKQANETAQIRSVGFTIETKPDYCKQEHVDMMLNYGITRIEIGVQSLQESVYKIVNRGHTYSDVVDSFQISKDAGYKIVAHMMPGLPTVTMELKKSIPKWCRIMRVQREIGPNEIIAGPKSGNLRQIVLDRLKKQNQNCKCIRCREVGFTSEPAKEAKLHRENYTSSGGEEVFLSYDDSDDRIYGFLRLRKPSPKSHRSEVTQKTSIVRELHVYGKSLKIGEHENGQIQHSGLGKNLMSEAEKIAKEEFDSDKLLVISAVGTREYYRKIGYTLDGPYMAKKLE